MEDEIDEIAEEGMEANDIHERLQELGLELNDEAVNALCSLSVSHAFELLDTVKSKVDMGHIKSPSNYISATIARGYVPQADGGAVVASIFLAGGDAPPSVQPHPWDGGAASNMASPPKYKAEGKGNYADDNFDAAAARLASSKGMLKAQQANLQLNDDAVRALLQLEVGHASELLETVADKHTTLRDPSNYIIVTVQRGFVSKARDPSPQPPPPPPQQPRRVPPRQPPRQPPQPPPWEPPVVTPAPINSAPAAYDNGSVGKTVAVHGPSSLVPSNLSQVEAKVLELNAQDLWSGQSISVETLLALRCVRQDQALGLLTSLEAKGRGKGSVSIQSPNNYVQAAVVKIGKEKAEGASASRSEGVSVPPWQKHRDQPVQQHEAATKRTRRF